MLWLSICVRETYARVERKCASGVQCDKQVQKHKVASDIRCEGVKRELVSYAQGFFKCATKVKVSHGAPCRE